VKKELLLAVLLAGQCAGCITRYQITLTNGKAITARSRPILDNATDSYHFKDGQGQEVWVKAIRVREIERK
jgi:hypothetical protein